MIAMFLSILSFLAADVIEGPVDQWHGAMGQIHGVTRPGEVLSIALDTYYPCAIM